MQIPVLLPFTFHKSRALFLLLLITNLGLAQTPRHPLFTVSAYAEAYYANSTSFSADKTYPEFIYNHKKGQQPSLNLAFVKVNHQSKRMRSNVALMAGDYSKYNLAAEPKWAKPILEANLGVKLSNKKNIWLDAGVMPSHIGFESAISADCWTVTRSILAENSPYFETGIKLSYTSPFEKWNLAVLALNGWQRINFVKEFKNPSYGFQLNYKPKTNLQFNYSNFIGYDYIENQESLRHFHNVYAIYEPTEKVGFTFGFDIGNDKISNSKSGIWYSPVGIARYKINSQFRTAFRAEFYRDKNQLIIPTQTTTGSQILGLSSNLDCQIGDNWLWRMEVKNFESNAPLFGAKNSTYAVATSLVLKL
ncbi:MAG: porin [Flavobacterium sp.]|nr:porin [Flavobacterium sp.]